MMQGIPTWLFYSASAAVMLVSFLLFGLQGRMQAAAPGGYATYDLLQVRWLRRPLRSAFLKFVLRAAVTGLFLLVILTGLFGSRYAGSNLSTVLTWTVWWILLVLLIALFGKAWCYLCPWDAISWWFERLSFWKVKQETLSLNLQWPRKLRNIYPAVLLFLLLTWLELGWGVTRKPEVTAYLALLMLMLAFVPAFIFERRSFCRYGCLVGRISGLYALFSSLEIRARDRDVCVTCRTRDCVRGNERGYGCPTYQYLGTMDKNTYCIFCGECIRTCPNDNVAVNVRFFARDLVKTARTRSDEAAMVIVMLAMTTFHGMTMIPQWYDVTDALRSALRSGYVPAFTVGMFVLIGVLLLFYLILVRVSLLMAGRDGLSFRRLAINYSYAFLPIALFYHFAHNAAHFVSEAGAIVPVLSDPFGVGWNLFGTANINPGPLLSVGAVWYLQVGLIVVGHVWALYIADRIGRQEFGTERAAFRGQLPMLVAMIGYSVLSLWITAQPMEMRTSM